MKEEGINETNGKNHLTELNATMELLQAALDGSLDIIQVFKPVRDADNNIIDFTWLMNNKRGIEQNGDVIGESLLRRNPGVVETGIFQRMVQVVETGIANEQEQYYPHEQFDGWFRQTLVKSGDAVMMTTRDITEQKKTEQEILRLKDEVAQKATDKYRTLFNSIDEGFSIIELIFDQEGKVIDYWHREDNSAFERLTGIKDAVGKRMSELIPYVEPEWHQMIEKIYYTGEPIQVEYPVQALRKWFRAYMSRVGGPGSPLIACVYDDITERKQGEQNQEFLLKFSDALRAEFDADAMAERAVRMLAEYLQLDRCYVGVCLLADNIGIFPYQFGNDKVPPMPKEGVQLSDFPEALRITFDETLVITDFQNTERLTKKERQNFEVLGFGALVVANVRKGEKSPLWAINAVSATPRHWTESEIRLVEAVTERTWAAVERAKAEDALRASEAKYRTLFNSIDEGFHIIELIYNEEGKAVDYQFQEVNQSFVRHTGLKDVVGKYGSQITPNTESVWFEAYDKVLKTGKPIRFEDYNHFTGAWYSTFAFPIGEPQQHHVAVLFSNITERKKDAERQAYMLKLSETLRLLTDPSEIEWAVSMATMEYYRADRCYYCEIDGGKAIIRRDAARGELASVSGVYPLDSFTLFKQVVETGLPFVVIDAAKSDILDEELRTLCLQLQVISFVDVPVVRSGKVIGIFCLVQSKPRSWSTVEVELAAETANRISIAVERTKAIEALRASEERLQIAINTARTVVWEWNVKENKIETTPNFKDIYGLSSIDFAEQGYSLLFPADRDVHLTKVQKATEDAGGYLSQFRIIRPDTKEIVWLEERADSVVDETGKVVKLIGASIDITELKKTEEAWQKSEQQLRKRERELSRVQEIGLVAGIDVSFDPDMEQSYSWRSPEYQKLHGLLPGTEHETHDDWLRRIHPDDRVQANEVLKHAIKSGSLVYQGEYRIVRPIDGQIRWIYARADIDRNAEEKTIRLVGAHIDVTERKQVEQQLQKFNVHLEQEVAERTKDVKDNAHFIEKLTVASPDNLFVMNIHTKEIVYTNRSPAEVLGYTRAQRQKMENEFLDIVHPEDFPYFIAHIDNMVTAKDGEVRLIEYHVLDADGKVRWMHDRNAVFKRDATGKVIEKIGVTHEVTDQKNSQEEVIRLRLLQQKELLDAVLKSQERERERIGEALHNGIGQLLYAAQIKCDLLSESAEPIAKILKELTDILNEAISETRNISFELIPTVLKDFGLAVAIKTLLQRIAHPGLRIQFSTQHGDERITEILEISIYRIVQELLNNIVKHSRATAASVRIEQSAQYIALKVVDNGIGFDLKSVVEKNKGIGLQSIRNRAKLLNAELNIKTQPGKGTKVTVEIPLV